MEEIKVLGKPDNWLQKLKDWGGSALDTIGGLPDFLASLKAENDGGVDNTPQGETDTEKTKSPTTALAAMLGSSSIPQVSVPQSPGSITPQFARIGQGGGAASGLGPIVQGGYSPLAGMAMGLRGLGKNQGWGESLDKWAKSKLG